MKALFLFSIFLLASCFRSVALVHPTTGQTVQCSGGGVGPIAGSIKAAAVSRCVEEYERLGYVQADKLTPEQKAKLKTP